jgi:2-polyprenyl-6-methoxyphenol hydroxylase-like FAD-dependent oxidoreductase
MLKVVEGWDETIRAVISLIPPGVLIDWKLLWRDPVKRWVSETGRIVLIGDAAHPHLPTSGTGATQAIEDGATIGALVEILGADKVPLIFRAYEKLRYDLFSLCSTIAIILMQVCFGI